MLATYRWWKSDLVTTRFSLEWPNHPELMNTLLAIVVVIGVFLGLGTLTQQRWLAWIGLGLGLAIALTHLIRHRRTAAARAAAARALGARMIGRCGRVVSPPQLAALLDTRDELVLVLTDDMLYLCQNGGTLTALTSIALYDIESVEVLEEGLALRVTPSGMTPQTFRFEELGPRHGAAGWAAALRRSRR